MIYGFAHKLQSEAWSLSEGVLAGFIGFDRPTTSTICTTQLQSLLSVKKSNDAFKKYLRTGAAVINLMYFQIDFRGDLTPPFLKV